MSAFASPARAAELAQHYALCESALREKDRDLWLAALFAPAERRRHLHALYAFWMEIDEVRAKVTQPLLGEMRLRWWADTLEAPGGEGGAAHPIADAVVDTIAARGLSRVEFATFLDAHVVDLYDDPVETLAALLAYCDATVGAVLRWSAACLGGRVNAEADRVLADAGTALGLTRILRRLPLGGGRFVPLELLDRHGASPDDARAGGLDDATRTALLPVATVPLYLELMSRRDYNPFRWVAEPQPWRRQWRLWRAARAGL